MSNGSVRENPNHMFIDRHAVKQLGELLRAIPAMVEDLAITETRQANTRRPHLGTRRARPESAIPVHLGAWEAAEALRNQLTGWVRVVCEQRALDSPPVDDITSAARWLERNLIALAMTEGAETAYPDLAYAVKQCWRMIDLPDEDDVIIDQARVDAANRSVLTAYQVEKIAYRLGKFGKGLNRDRVEHLRKHKFLRPCMQDGNTRLYRLGDVLHAHVVNVRRDRHSKAA